MEDVLIKIFISIGVLFFIMAMVSIFRYSYGIQVTKKAIYVSSVYMLLGMLSLVVVIYLTKPAMTLFFFVGWCGNLWSILNIGIS